MIIRKSNKSDLNTILSLLEENKLPIEDINNNNILFFLALQNNQAVGVIGLEAYQPFGLLRSLAVKDSQKNRQVGTALANHLLSYCRVNGILELFLLTTTAQNYFPKFGFKPINRKDVPSEIQNTTEYKDLCPDTAMVMQLSIQKRI